MFVPMTQNDKQPEHKKRHQENLNGANRVEIHQVQINEIKTHPERESREKGKQENDSEINTERQMD